MTIFLLQKGYSCAFYFASARSKLRYLPYLNMAKQMFLVNKEKHRTLRELVQSPPTAQYMDHFAKPFFAAERNVSAALSNYYLSPRQRITTYDDAYGRT